MQLERPSDIVQAWQEAVNDQDVDRLLELSDDNIEIVGPRGSGYGHQLLRDWLARAGLQLQTVRVFAGGNVVVVAQQGVWRAVATGERTGERPVASRFRVADRRVVQFARYDSLDTALADAGLNYADEIFPDPAG